MPQSLTLAALVTLAARHRASDLHVAAGRPVLLRVRGELRLLTAPAAAVGAAEAQAMARSALRDEEWARFQQQGSADTALTIEGVRCRVNVLRSAGGIGLAVRLLPSTTVTLESLNLHPDLVKLVESQHGLVIVSGPTGCGKSSTLAALVQEINRSRASHIVTIEHPIEFELRSEKAFIRQREVGRDTPSVAQGLLDALRQDIDVLMVGEMRERETMRLTLDVCETGHLVLTTLHSSTVIDALQRLVAAFPAEEQPSVCAQLADCLIAVVTQHLVWRDDPGLLVPECEVLTASTSVRSILRQGQFFKLATALETGARTGSWSLQRYREWLSQRTSWSLPGASTAVHDRPRARQPRPASDGAARPADDVIEIEPAEGSLSDIVSELEKE